MQAETKEQPALLCGDALEFAANGKPTLMGAVCGDCGAKQFPFAPVCCVCGGEKTAREAMPRTGTLYSFSVVHVAPKKWKKPMVVGYVDLDNGVRLFTHLDGADFAIGDRVEVDVGVVGEEDGQPLRNFVFRRPA